jgi:hypothetical protein
MPIKVNGLTTGSVTLAAPDTGSDVTVSLPGVSGELLPLAGGKILQIVRATDSTQRSTTSTSFVDANLSVTITPQKNDSAILLVYSASTYTDGAAGYIIIQITDSSNNAVSGAQESFIGSGSTADFTVHSTLIGYATPATTNATTYKVRFRRATGGTAILQNAAITGQLYAIEVSA